MEVEGGGERNGKEGMLGKEVDGNGGRLTCGTVVGMVVGMVLGSGGKVGRVVGLGRVGCGKDGIVGNGGTLP